MQQILKMSQTLGQLSEEHVFITGRENYTMSCVEGSKQGGLMKVESDKRVKMCLLSVLSTKTSSVCVTMVG